MNESDVDVEGGRVYRFGAGANELGDPKADQLIVAYIEGSSIRRWQVHTETGASSRSSRVCEAETGSLRRGTSGAS